jgi:hypothetical protein
MSERVQVVFLGPSLARSEAQQILPDAVFLPPAAMGDILGALRRYQPHSIGLIDGTFLQNMSVFHKELLYAIDNGAYVLGGSSMGALRAAECARYGVIGIGEIYEAFASGELDNDADVALTHANAEADFRPLSDAMVTIRAVLRGAQDSGLLTPTQTTELVLRQEQRWFPERRVVDSLADAAELGITGDHLSELREFFKTQTRELDPKRKDAIALLHAMRELPDDPPPLESRPKTVMSGVFQAVLARDVIVETEDGHRTTFDQIRRYAALSEADYDDAMRTARQHNVLAWIGYWFAGPPSQAELDRATERLAVNWGVSIEEVPARASALDLDKQGLNEFLVRDALVLRMESSYLGRTQHGVITKLFLDELRKRGRYEEVKHAAALQQSLSRSVIADGDISPQQALATHLSLSEWQFPEDLNQYVEDNELGSVGELLQSVIASVRAYQGLFGTGLLPDVGEGVEFFDTGEPMMTRGS